MKIVFILVIIMVVLSPTQGLPPLKALGLLTQILLPQSKNYDGGKYLLDSFRTEHLIPSLTRIKQFLFSVDEQIVTFKIAISVAFIVIGIAILVIFMLYYNLRSKIEKLKK